VISPGDWILVNNGTPTTRRLMIRSAIMKNRVFLRSVTALFIALICLVWAMPALATPPERLTIPTAGTFILAECDGFDVIDDYTGVLAITEFYDQDGDLVRLTFHENAHDRIYNSVTGFSVYNNYAVNQTYDPATSEIYIRGVAYNITVPGYGIVYFDSGLGVFYIEDGNYIEIKFAGNYRPDTASLCEAMDQ
jgi:hypothetical protein